MPTIKTLAAAKTDAQRKQVAQNILRLRKAGTSWDGADGIVSQGIVSGAPQGRALLRKYNLADTGNGIAKSYDRDSYGLKGPRTPAAPAKKGRKTGKATPAKATARKPAVRKATPARKPAARKATK